MTDFVLLDAKMLTAKVGNIQPYAYMNPPVGDPIKMEIMRAVEEAIKLYITSFSIELQYAIDQSTIPQNEFMIIRVDDNQS